MARWIGVAQDAKCKDENNKDTKLLALLGNGHMAAWKPISLAKHFGGQNKHPLQLLPAEIDPESELMQALAEVDEDEWLENENGKLLCKTL